MALCNHIRSKVVIIITSPVITDFRQEVGTENRGLAHLKPVLKQVLVQYELKYSYLFLWHSQKQHFKIKHVLYVGWAM